MKIDKKIIKELNEYLEEFNLTEIEITEKDTKIKISKNIRSKSVATTFNLLFLISRRTLDNIGKVFFLSIMLCAIDNDLINTSRFI
mgnify:CR=1 FL=1